MTELGAYYYLWYDKDQWNVWKSINTPSKFYDSSDQETISQHITWAKGHGITFFVVSWAGPDEKRDRNLRKAFLTNPLSQQIKFAILYESEARLRPPNGTLNLDDPEKRRTLVDDFGYLGDNYFRDGRYLKIDDKPVVVLYLSRILEGDLGRAIAELRSKCNKLYLVGDEVYWGRLTRPRFGRPKLGNLEPRMKLYDAVTAYNMHTSDAKKLADFETQLESEYKDWSSALSPTSVDLIPDVIPGFNDTRIPNRENIPLQRTTERFDRQVTIATRYASKRNVIIITSFNEWHEDTQVEPAKEYGEQYLRVLQNRRVV